MLPRLARSFVALFIIFAVPCRAQDAAAVDPARLTANVDGTNIDVYFYKPAGAGKFPLLILSHGDPRDPEDRAKFGADTLKKEAEAYVASGVAVAVPIRRGYGGNGEFVEGYGNCKAAHYYEAGLEGAQDIQAVISTLSQRPDVDASRIVLMGVSAGGWASLAAATQGGVLGVVNFAGGRGSRGTDAVCAEYNLVDAAGRYGKESHVPELWIYSENDHYFYPALAQRLYQAFISSGGTATFITAPAYEEDGHHYIRNISSWKVEVDGFLAKIGFLK
jgi:dienelactone hydrolase